MKIPYHHLLNLIPSKPDIKDISSKLFQLGHEHEIEDQIFDIEITPNRGDCLSVDGILRELSIFYDVRFHRNVYENEIEKYHFDFKNDAINDCPQISFLRIDIDHSSIAPYSNELESYFDDLKQNKNNFFTDISNYVLYETGQPTHCYDSSKINESIRLARITENISFNTLLNTDIELEGSNLVFLDNDKIINLAGIVGGSNSSCSKETSSVIIECAHFNPESIINKSTKYDINSDAAYKFERNTDPCCHELVLRRFIYIVSKHANIQSVKLFSKNYKEFSNIIIDYDLKRVNKIIGTNISDNEYKTYLNKLGFKFSQGVIQIPSFRNDIKTQNDLAEEVARVIGYNNISPIGLNIKSVFIEPCEEAEYKLKNLLIDNGFYEVINNPFSDTKDENQIMIDNPLDSNKNLLRTSLRNSLINNLIYNERRQKDSIKLFEISDIYSSPNLISSERKIGIIASGRQGKNYLTFSKFIDLEYLISIFGNYYKNLQIKIENISRESLNSKVKNPIFYIELDVSAINKDIKDYMAQSKPVEGFSKYIPISEYPSSSRDISFLIEDYNKLSTLQKYLNNYSHDLLKELFIFDYYKNEEKKILKIAYRFIFQSSLKTITEEEVNKVVNDIISNTLEIKSISIPGLNL